MPTLLRALALVLVSQRQLQPRPAIPVVKLAMSPPIALTTALLLAMRLASPVGGPHSTGEIEGAAAEKTAREKKGANSPLVGGGWGSAGGAGRAADSAGAVATKKKNVSTAQRVSSQAGVGLKGRTWGYN